MQIRLVIIRNAPDRARCFVDGNKVLFDGIKHDLLIERFEHVSSLLDSARVETLEVKVGSPPTSDTSNTVAAEPDDRVHPRNLIEVKEALARTTNEGNLDEVALRRNSRLYAQVCDFLALLYWSQCERFKTSEVLRYTTNANRESEYFSHTLGTMISSSYAVLCPRDREKENRMMKALKSSWADQP